jgi:phosphatidylglycerophosphate synthase
MIADIRSQVPNTLSIIRCLCGIYILFDLNINIFLFACCTDFLDGYIARRFNQISAFGATLDQVSDKVLCNCTMFKLYLNGADTILIPAILIATRDVAISRSRYHTDLPSTYISKIKTLVIMLALSLLITKLQFGIELIWIVAIFSWISYFNVVLQ